MAEIQSTTQNCLIVDDDPIFVAMLEQTLINHGLATVYTAFDGLQGLEILKANMGKIHAITLDLNMPNEDGIGFLTSLASLGYGGEVILSSSEHKSVLDSALQLARMLKLNCNEAFAKPVDFDALAKSVIRIDGASTHCAPKKDDKTVMDIALNELRIEAYYQARMNLDNLCIDGAEVLARIQDGNGKFLNTQDVIEHAEATGKIADLTWKMLDNLAIGARHLNDYHQRRPVLSVNINGQLMASAGFSSDLVNFFKQAEIDPKQIILEITETGLPPDPAAALEAFARIRMHGFGIAIDDFGTGYSNIENLKLFPFTELKIDKSFVSNAHNDPFSRECISASVRLANELTLTVVAEGIETEQDLDLVKSLNIMQAQGYLFAKPQPLAEFSNFYANGYMQAEQSNILTFEKIAS